ncbi:uncharacterized protein JN550_003382 [Neoarthrinium moseri]|uniref:uncharacterized protein n=1 Tax=Neoarthrinium moseri TaxID=1658444 RepID=UPI001FDC6E0B|nr:uncharacterized protein JN550_003382 [Neoarthrinium moseri]KAI1873129.1 hypothetical protein JN550_003382 [Neoarthrinium moseri]
MVWQQVAISERMEADSAWEDYLSEICKGYKKSFETYTGFKRFDFFRLRQTCRQIRYEACRALMPANKSNQTLEIHISSKGIVLELQDQHRKTYWSTENLNDIHFLTLIHRRNWNIEVNANIYIPILLLKCKRVQEISGIWSGANTAATLISQLPSVNGLNINFRERTQLLRNKFYLQTIRINEREERLHVLLTARILEPFLESQKFLSSCVNPIEVYHQAAYNKVMTLEKEAQQSQGCGLGIASTVQPQKAISISPGVDSHTQLLINAAWNPVVCQCNFPDCTDKYKEFVRPQPVNSVVERIRNIAKEFEDNIYAACTAERVPMEVTRYTLGRTADGRSLIVDQLGIDSIKTIEE